MSSSHVGMKTYQRILNEARMNKRPVGSAHHMHDGQLKEWIKNRVTVARTAPKTACTTARTTANTQAPTPTHIETHKLKAKVQAKVAEVKAAAPSLREKHTAENMNKLSEMFKFESSGRLKSAGNGL